MILFNWNKLIHHSNNESKKFFAILHHITFDSLPMNRKDILYSVQGKDFSGSSYLLQPEQLFYNFKTYSTQEWVEYVKLASMRNYNDYRISKDKTLAAHITNITKTSNRLLTLKDDKISFKFEDAMEN